MDAGLTKQFSATGRDATGSAVTTTFTWKSGDTTVATVSAGGLASGVTAGTATITATSANGIAATATLTVTPASTATGPIYRNHLEFGMPVDADPSDDYILTKPQYVVSYNRNRNLPNWVAWNLNATQLGTAPRCDCFSPDPQLPDEFLHVTTSDYTGSGYDRGHMVTSSQRNYSPAENAVTYLMTNILPQAPDNNQGPWEVMESYLTDLAKSQGKELYIVSGGTWSAGSKYLTNSTGVKIPIPDSTWKIVVIMPAGQGLANVTSASSIQVIAAMFPNVQGIRSVDWNTYRTTVRKIEQTTGYNFLSALPDDIEEMVETTP
jgi:endonuclease G